MVFDNLDTKLSCRSCLGERIGCDSGPSCNGVRHRRSWCWRHSASYRMRQCVSTRPLDGFLLLELSFESNLFTQFSCCGVLTRNNLV